MNFKELFVFALIMVVAVAVGVHFGSPKSFGDSKSYVQFTSPTQATSSVSIYTPSLILSQSGSRQYASICNTSPTTTNNLLLEFDATSTATGLNAPARIVPGNSCYDLTGDNMFTGNLYGIFQTNTATVQTLVK